MHRAWPAIILTGNDAARMHEFWMNGLAHFFHNYGSVILIAGCCLADARAGTSVFRRWLLRCATIAAPTLNQACKPTSLLWYRDARLAQRAHGAKVSGLLDFRVGVSEEPYRRVGYIHFVKAYKIARFARKRRRTATDMIYSYRRIAHKTLGIVDFSDDAFNSESKQFCM